MTLEEIIKKELLKYEQEYVGDIVIEWNKIEKFITDLKQAIQQQSNSL